MANILIVDDIVENLHVLQLILKSENHTVRAATNAALALQLVEKKRPDIIITDIKMPVMSGIELCQTLKSKDESKHIPIIFVSAQTDTDNIVQALEAGGVDYLTKPFRPAEIVARVSTQIKLIEAHNLRVGQELSHAINQMVVGVAHEINTPLGTSITAVTHLKSIIESLMSSYMHKTLSATQLEAKLKDASESITLSENNLMRVAEFVNLLKMISRAKGPRKLKNTNLESFIKNILTLSQELYHGLTFNLQLNIHQSDFNLDTELLALVFNNLIQDSFTHALQADKTQINIIITEKNNGFDIHYSDNGNGLQGLSIEQLLKPFYTSKRGNSGHVGLSAPMVASIISGPLNGKYQITSSKNGIEWVIELPHLNA